MIACPFCKLTYSSNLSQCPSCRFSPNISGLPSSSPEINQIEQGFKAEYFSPLANVEKGYFWFEARNALIIWAITKYFSKMKSFFEVGCGTGFVLSAISSAFPSAKISGSEIFSEGIAIAQARISSALLMQMDARKVPFLEEFDVIGAFDVLEHIEEDELVLAEFFKAIKPGGGLIISVPQHRWLWSAADDYACHVRRYDSKDLKRKIAAAGFEIVRATSFMSFTLPLMVISRARSEDEAQFDPMAEFSINPILNRLLLAILGLERFCIRLGLNFNFGGSYLMIAKKPK
jgi:2-polyprenyl-3-methyl-5-hydroxy-6-metoxy-1,4-benzoquinol methylase